jgi:hypothetical protein
LFNKVLQLVLQLTIDPKMLKQISLHRKKCYGMKKDSEKYTGLRFNTIGFSVRSYFIQMNHSESVSYP